MTNYLTDDEGKKDENSLESKSDEQNGKEKTEPYTISEELPAAGLDKDEAQNIQQNRKMQGFY